MPCLHQQPARARGCRLTLPVLARSLMSKGEDDLATQLGAGMPGAVPDPKAGAHEALLARSPAPHCHSCPSHTAAQHAGAGASCTSAS